MDAEHRHGLKSNELAEGISHLPTLLKENANTVIGVALILVGLISWPLLSKMSGQKDIAKQSEMTYSIQMLEQDIMNVLRTQQTEGASDEEALNTLLLNAESLMDEASEADNPNLEAMALIKAAQALRTELHLRKEVDPQTMETQLNKAQEAYERAAQVAYTATLKAMAQFGLGLCSEEFGQFAQAKEIYSAIVAEKSFESTAISKLAQQRLNDLDDNSETFTFVQTPKPIPPAILPETLTLPDSFEMSASETSPEVTETPLQESVTE